MNEPSGGRVYASEDIHASLRTSLLGRRVELHQQVVSTNDLAKQAARRGESEGLVILSEEQVAGRGRLGRTWVAPPGCCILCSVLLRPRFSPEQAFYLTIAASLAIYRVCKGLLDRDRGLGVRERGSESQGGQGGQGGLIPDPRSPIPSIKWPNDVLLNGRKVSGVLSESEFSGGEWAFCVVGFGINVNLDEAELGTLAETATSLSIELGYEVDRTALLASVLGELEAIYLLLQGGQFDSVFDEWACALGTIGKRVTVQEPGNVITGRALRVDRGGALVVRLDSGEERRVLAGDVLPGASDNNLDV